MTNRLQRLAAAVALAVATTSTPLAAQTSNPSAAADAGPLTIAVTAVQGGAQYRPEGQSKWQALAGGTKLPEGVEIRTGPKGAVQFTVGTDQVYRVDRLTIAKILRASLRPDGSIKTDVGMQYGRVSKDVDAPERPHEDTIVSPSSTLAVRGTRVSLYDQPPYEPEAVSLTGRAVFNTLGRKVVAFGAKGEGTATVTASTPDPAGNALNNSIVDPSIAGARTPAEQRLLADLITQGAVVSFDRVLMLPVVTGGKVPAANQLRDLVPGQLVFYVRWDTNTNVDTRLVAATSGKNAEFVFPFQGLDRTPTGGRILFDHRGGPNGGFEVVTYPTQAFPTGIYAISGANKGPLPTTVTFDAFVDHSDGKGLVRQLFLNPTFDFSQPLVSEVSMTAEVGQTAAAAAPVREENIFQPVSPTPFPITGFAAAAHAPRRAKQAISLPVLAPRINLPPSRVWIPPTKR